MAGPVLDRDDPHLSRDRVGQKRRLRLGTLTLGARLRPLVAWQAARVEVNQDIEATKHRKEDVPQDVVDKIVEDTNVSASP